MPALDMTMTEGAIARWLKAEGDQVRKGEALLEVETDKAIVEIESPLDGILGPIIYPEGARVEVGTPITSVLEVGEAAPRPMPAPQETKAGPASQHGEHRLSPRARRMAREAGIPESEVEGRHAADVDKAIAAGSRPASHRELIGRRLADSWREIPHFAVTREIDAEALLAHLALARAEGVEASVTDLMLQALARALNETGTARPDIALAIDTPAGVAAPVITDVLSLDLNAIGRRRRVLVERARANRLALDDMKGNPVTTFSNLGALGIDQFTGVITLGQTSLLTVGRIKARAAARGRALLATPTFFATLNADHRALDGADAARLLAAFAARVEGPAEETPNA